MLVSLYPEIFRNKSHSNPIRRVTGRRAGARSCPLEPPSSGHSPGNHRGIPHGNHAIKAENIGILEGSGIYIYIMDYNGVYIYILYIYNAII